MSADAPPPFDSSNPYAVPNAVAASAPVDAASAELATRGERLAGALIDLLLMGLCLTPGLFFAPRTPAGAAPGAGGGGSLAALGLSLCFLVLIGMQTYLITTTGQSVGKRLLRMRIVRTDGSAPGFVHGVLLRSWIWMVFGGLPVVGGLVTLANYLAIFGEQQRCLHDRVAGTRVVRVPR